MRNLHQNYDLLIKKNWLSEYYDCQGYVYYEVWNLFLVSSKIDFSEKNCTHVEDIDF